MRLMDAHSWFPRNKKKFSGYLICRLHKSKALKSSGGDAWATQHVQHKSPVFAWTGHAFRLLRG